MGRPLVMKGFDYTVNLYPEIGLGHANDIDLLVEPGTFSDTCEILASQMEQRATPRENRRAHEPPSAITFAQMVSVLTFIECPLWSIKHDLMWIQF